MDDKIKKWVDDSISQGYSIEKIKQNLVNFGYKKDEVDSLTKDLKEIKKTTPEINKINISEKIKEKILSYYVLIPSVMILVILIISAVFVFGRDSESNSINCNPIFISLQKACISEGRIFLSIKNEGITFSKFKYYINERLANEKEFIFDPEKTVDFSIKLSLFEEQEIKDKFSEAKSIKFAPISNGEECIDKTVSASNLLNNC